MPPPGPPTAAMRWTWRHPRGGWVATLRAAVMTSAARRRRASRTRGRPMAATPAIWHLGRPHTCRAGRRPGRRKGARLTCWGSCFAGSSERWGLHTRRFEGWGGRLPRWAGPPGRLQLGCWHGSLHVGGGQACTPRTRTGSHSHGNALGWGVASGNAGLSAVFEHAAKRRHRRCLIVRPPAAPTVHCAGLCVIPA